MGFLFGTTSIVEFLTVLIGLLRTRADCLQQGKDGESSAVLNGLLVGLRASVPLAILYATAKHRRGLIFYYRWCMSDPCYRRYISKTCCCCARKRLDRSETTSE